MKAAFSLVVRYDVTATCISPLRTGGAAHDPDAVLADPAGRFMIQGASLAGAMREWLRKHSSEKEETTALFGTQAAPGTLTISDGIFDPSSAVSSRPRLRIDGRTGTGSNGAFFSVVALPGGSKFTFSVLWSGFPEQHEQQLAVVEQIFSAIQSGQICFGAQKANGFGRVSVRVRKKLYDMSDPEGLTAWMDDSMEGAEQLTLPEAIADVRQAVFTLSGNTDAILVRSGSLDKDRAAVNMRERDSYLIPGSSVKGAIRNRVAQIAATLDIDPGVTNQIFGFASDRTQTGSAGIVRFEDVKLENHTRTVTRIRINRFTGAVMNQALAKEKPVSSRVTLRVTAPADQPLACLLLLYALRDLGVGLYPLGSGGSVGRGFISGETLTVRVGARELCLKLLPDGAAEISGETEILEEWREVLK